MLRYLSPAPAVHLLLRQMPAYDLAHKKENGVAKDYYSTLGVNNTATPEEIKTAFRRLAHQYHPDKSTGDAEKFKDINEAYQVLSDSEKRKQYDQYGQTFEQAQAQGGFGGFEGFRDWSTYAQGAGVNVEDLGDLFGGLGEMFGMGGRRGARRERNGRDLETTITIDFAQMVHGGTVDLTLDRDVPCSDCNATGAEKGKALSHCRECGGSGQKAQARRTMFGTFQTVSVCGACQGTGKMIDKKCSHCHGRGIVRKKETLAVNVPAGIENGATLRLRGQGEAAPNGQSGDLYIHVRVRSHQTIGRIPDSNDLLTTARINIVEAALGSTKDVAAVDGVVAVEIPEGVETGQRLRLKGKGIESHRGRGDLYVSIEVETPKRISRSARKLLEELKREL